MTTHDKQADYVDVYVGSRIRTRRKLTGMSQDALAQKIGVTFQQVQKYERGSNRISASMLVRTAKALEVPVQFFFDAVPDGPPKAAPKADPIHTLAGEIYQESRRLNPKRPHWNDLDVEDEFDRAAYRSAISMAKDQLQIA